MNRKLYRLDWAESVVLEILAKQLDQPSLYRPYFDLLNEESRRVTATTSVDRDNLMREVAKWTRAIDATFVPSCTTGASPESVVRNRMYFEQRLASAREALGKLPTARATVEIDIARAADLKGALREFASVGTLRMLDEASARLIDAARSLFTTVHLIEEPGGVRIQVGFKILALARTAAPGGDDDDLVIEEFVPVSRCRGRYGATVRRRETGTEDFHDGPWTLSNEEWEMVRGLLSQGAFARYEGRAGDARSLVELALFLAVHHRPLARCPKEFGDLDHVRRALRLLISGGRWDAIAATLMRQAPHRMAGYDPSFLRSFRRYGPKKGSHAQDIDRKLIIDRSPEMQSI